ncbi:hypothetical protein VD0003_g9144 [Verticillium dahliae]|nr:hypothetical protein VD0003_g9144 [Verticillium dahliae]
MDTSSNPRQGQPGGPDAALPTYHELSNLEAQPPQQAAPFAPTSQPAGGSPNPDTIEAPGPAHLPDYGEASQSKPPQYERYKNEPPPGFSGRENQRWQYAHWIVVMTVFLGIGLGVGIYYGVVSS